MKGKGREGGPPYTMVLSGSWHFYGSMMGSWMKV